MGQFRILCWPIFVTRWFVFFWLKLRQILSYFVDFFDSWTDLGNKSGRDLHPSTISVICHWIVVQIKFGLEKWRTDSIGLLRGRVSRCCTVNVVSCAGFFLYSICHFSCFLHPVEHRSVLCRNLSVIGPVGQLFFVHVFVHGRASKFDAWIFDKKNLCKFCVQVSWPWHISIICEWCWIFCNWICSVVVIIVACQYLVVHAWYIGICFLLV